MHMSIDFFLKDELKLEPARAQAFRSLTHLPWNVKPVRSDWGLVDIQSLWVESRVRVGHHLRLV